MATCKFLRIVKNLPEIFEDEQMASTGFTILRITIFEI